MKTARSKLRELESVHLPDGIWYSVDKDCVIEKRGDTFFDGEEAVVLTREQTFKIYGHTFLFLED